MDALETLRHEALKPSQIIYQTGSHVTLVNKALLRHNYVEMLSR